MQAIRKALVDGNVVLHDGQLSVNYSPAMFAAVTKIMLGLDVAEQLRMLASCRP